MHIFHSNPLRDRIKCHLYSAQCVYRGPYRSHGKNTPAFDRRRCQQWAQIIRIAESKLSRRFDFDFVRKCCHSMLIDRILHTFAVCMSVTNICDVCSAMPKIDFLLFLYFHVCASMWWTLESWRYCHWTGTTCAMCVPIVVWHYTTLHCICTFFFCFETMRQDS